MREERKSHENKKEIGTTYENREKKSSGRPDERFRFLIKINKVEDVTDVCV